MADTVELEIKKEKEREYILDVSSVCVCVCNGDYLCSRNSIDYNMCLRRIIVCNSYCIFSSATDLCSRLCRCGINNCLGIQI